MDRYSTIRITCTRFAHFCALVACTKGIGAILRGFCVNNQAMLYEGTQKWQKRFRVKAQDIMHEKRAMDLCARTRTFFTKLAPQQSTVLHVAARVEGACRAQ